jgi:hypothetical protein
MSQLSKTRVSKVFSVKFELEKARKGKKKTVEAGLFEWFVKHFGEIEVAGQYKVTVEVVK